ncbi:hypothetical protein BV25DRAFT_1371900 [Artomyces pyxidatus]|uniref:Uncharacterized protein n=1 Tax=Artomyces pyxidatus TaxID=48021 RepID=A0ACB8SMG4_9AGAM|nr:hypothetical protein BV25DRAFT_1371900 [Artomyces pyxidatus]
MFLTGMLWTLIFWIVLKADPPMRGWTLIQMSHSEPCAKRRSRQRVRRTAIPYRRLQSDPNANTTRFPVKGTVVFGTRPLYGNILSVFPYFSAGPFPSS